MSSLAQRLRRYQSVLKPLGLSDLFAATPIWLREMLCARKLPEPVLQFDASFPADADHRALRKRLEKAFAEAAIRINGEALTVRDFFAVIAGLMLAVQGAQCDPNLPAICLQFMREARVPLEQCYEQHTDEAFLALHSAVVVPLVAHSQIDTRLMGAGISTEPLNHGKNQVRMIIRSTEPQSRQVTIDRGTRRVYRVGTSNNWNGVTWASWNGAQFDPSPAAAKRDYPIFVQSHALRRMRERVNLPRMTPYLQSWMYQSLHEPNIVERQGEDLLVEYRIETDRLGYLIATPLPDEKIVVVRTFKFLTMEGTPEARRLEKQMRLSRRDADWLGLHELSAFTRSDLQDDPELRAMLESCGCGHLFELEEDDWYMSPEPKEIATQMRRYLGMAA